MTAAADKLAPYLEVPADLDDEWLQVWSPHLDVPRVDLKVRDLRDLLAQRQLAQAVLDAAANPALNGFVVSVQYPHVDKLIEAARKYRRSVSVPPPEPPT